MDNGLPVCVQQAALLLGIEVLGFQEMWNISLVLKDKESCMSRQTVRDTHTRICTGVLFLIRWLTALAPVSMMELA